jgi:hypothetical protein
MTPKEIKNSISLIEKSLQKKIQKRSEINYEITQLRETIKILKQDNDDTIKTKD